MPKIVKRSDNNATCHFTVPLILFKFCTYKVKGLISCPENNCPEACSLHYWSRIPPMSRTGFYHFPIAADSKPDRLAIGQNDAPMRWQDSVSLPEVVIDLRLAPSYR